MIPGTLQKFCLVMTMTKPDVRFDALVTNGILESHRRPTEYEGPCRSNIYISKRSLERFLDMKDDPVNLPAHYRNGDIECIDAIRAALGDAYPDYCRGNVMKYLWRYKNKNGIEDLLKAQWYLNAMIAATRIS